MSSASFFWHDYETSGTDARRDRPVQFAGQRTTADLEPLGEPVSFYCRPAPDVLPHPAACLLTGIAPQRAEREGLSEAEFAARVQAELGEPGTCSVGYNSIRFDDEFTRNLLYRNFYDPYEREWKDGNSRWDLIDLARLCYALRPAGIQWPRGDNGAPSFRLEHLTAANHLAHAQAHDALGDVQATIAFARLLRVRQPRLWDFHFALRRKQRAFELLDYAHRTPVLHASSRYPAERGCLAMIVPLAEHPTQPNGVICCDLDADPTDLLELDAQDIADRVFTARADLPEDVARIPLKTVHANKSPALAPLSVLRNVDTARIGLDVDRCLAHLERIVRAEDLAEKVRRALAVEREANPRTDAELAIYQGFASDADKRLFAAVRAAPPERLTARAFPFRDARYAELLFRYRARNHPQRLDFAEQERWREFRAARLSGAHELSTLTPEAYFAEIAALRATHAGEAGKLALLDAVEQWGRETLAD